MESPKVVVRLAGGLGNQLFQYAAARRLAYTNDVPLYLDAISGFERDPYKRSYSLCHFNIKTQMASPAQCYAGNMRRIFRYILRKWDTRKPIAQRKFIRESTDSVDSEFLNLKITKPVYVEGYWQSEKYFADIADIIRDELSVVSPMAPAVAEMASRIEGADNSVCVHVRHLYHLGRTDNERTNEVDIDYYRRAIDLIMQKVKRPHFFVFSDDAEWADREFAPLLLSEYPYTIVDKKLRGRDFESLHLMSRCHHFITSFSTFSWWGAWLGKKKDKIVCTNDR